MQAMTNLLLTHLYFWGKTLLNEIVGSCESVRGLSLIHEYWKYDSVAALMIWFAYYVCNVGIPSTEK